MWKVCNSLILAWAVSSGLGEASERVDHWTRSERIAKVIQKLFCFPEMRDLILEHTIGVLRIVTELIINGAGQQRSQQWITIRHLLIMVSNDKRMHLRRLQKGQRERFQKRRPGWQATQKMSPMQSLQWWGHKRWSCCGWSWGGGDHVAADGDHHHHHHHPCH